MEGHDYKDLKRPGGVRLSSMTGEMIEEGLACLPSLSQPRQRIALRTPKLCLVHFAPSNYSKTVLRRPVLKDILIRLRPLPDKPHP